LGKGNIGGVKWGNIVNLAIDVAMFSGQDYGTRWCTNGIGNAGIGKEHAFLGNSVYIGSVDEPVVIGANGLISMVIGHDENYVRFF
tara:strand:+ start:3959 stop:4216 length:258 start_codon:yes stop_codon:yes gene_type:complete